MGRITVSSGIDFSPLTDGDVCFNKSDFCGGVYFKNIAKDEIWVMNSLDQVYMKFKLDEDLNIASIIFCDWDGSTPIEFDMWNYKITMDSNYKIGEGSSSPWQITALNRMGVWGGGPAPENYWRGYIDQDRLLVPHSAIPLTARNGRIFYDSVLDVFVKSENNVWIREYSTQLSYTIGGVTINHPVGMFNNPPKVTVTPEPVSYAPNIILSAQIEINTNLLTIIRVNAFNITALAGGESPTGTVNFHVKFEGD